MRFVGYAHIQFEDSAAEGIFMIDVTELLHDFKSKASRSHDVISLSLKFCGKNI